MLGDEIPNRFRQSTHWNILIPKIISVVVIDPQEVTLSIKNELGSIKKFYLVIVILLPFCLFYGMIRIIRADIGQNGLWQRSRVHITIRSLGQLVQIHF